MKQQQRQEDDQENRGADRQVDDRRGDDVKKRGQRRMEQEGRNAADRHPDKGEQHGIGDL